jgi:hypothetical protein
MENFPSHFNEHDRPFTSSEPTLYVLTSQPAPHKIPLSPPRSECNSVNCCISKESSFLIQIFSLSKVRKLIKIYLTSTQNKSIIFLIAQVLSCKKSSLSSRFGKIICWELNMTSQKSNTNGCGRNIEHTLRHDKSQHCAVIQR